MNYTEALDYIMSVPAFSPKSIVNGSEPFDLVSITELLDRLGNPHQNLKYVHIAGTNGKGSTAAYIAEILEISGLKTGLYTSPFIERFTERIRVNGVEISEEDLARLTEKVKRTVEEMKADGTRLPSEYEIVSAIAFLYYKEMGCDIVVLEVGLGGRLDATNVIPCPELAVITTISFDHTEILGDSLGKIAFEKAGIIKNGGELILYPQSEEAERVICRVCEERNAILHKAAMPLKLISANLEGQCFSLMLDGKSEIYETGLLGNYQTNNAAVAIQAAKILQKKGWKINDEDIRTGILKTLWPGRFELLRENPYVIIDGSHNDEGASVLVKSLQQYFPDQKIIFIAGVLEDKDYAHMMKRVIPLAKKFYTITPPSPRALTAEKLSEFLLENGAASAVPVGNIKEAVSRAVAEATSDDIICAFGSLYYIGIVRSIVKEL